MCEFCIKHGDGKRWYLNAANYAEELLADTHRREYIRDFIPDVARHSRRWLKLLDFSNRVFPRLTGRVTGRKSEAMKAVHFGQVIPLEDVEAVMAVAGQVVRLPCVCREILRKKEEAVCYLLAADPEKTGLRDIIASRPEGIPYAGSLERVEPARALAEMAALEEQGKIHTIWTFITPFIGAICNCDPDGCLAMNFTARGLSLYLPGEWKSSVNPEKCTGCTTCQWACLFSAIGVEDGAARVDPDRCHGCGICRRVCSTGALSLRPTFA